MAFLANTRSLPQLNCSEKSDWSAGWRNDISAYNLGREKGF
jgi:hypothetical protein